MSKVGDRGDRLISPELQANRIKAYASNRGLDVEMLDPELDVSGGTLKRPILDNALERIEQGLAAGIIVAQLDRLSRAGLLDTHRIFRRAQAAGGNVISVAENFDDSPEGRMARNVMLDIGELQRERVKGGFEVSRRRAVAQGVWSAPHIPLGYLRGEDRHLYPDPVDASKVVRAFEARAAGEPWTIVGSILGKAPAGAQWVIRNRVYLGEVRMQIGGEETLCEGAHQPLIDRALYEAAQLEFPRAPRGDNGGALLATLIRCAGCQRRMSPTKRAYNCVPSNNGSGGRCEAPASIDRSRIDPYVEGVMLSHFGDSGFEKLAPTVEIADAERNLAEAEAELRIFQEGVEASGVGADFIATGLRKRVGAVEEARQTLGKARATTNTLDLITAATLWPTFTVEEKRHVLRCSLDVVWVRSAQRRKLPISERVRMIAVGFGPSGLSRPGISAEHVAPLNWDTELPGEVRLATTENVE